LGGVGTWGGGVGPWWRGGPKVPVLAGLRKGAAPNGQRTGTCLSGCRRLGRTQVGVQRQRQQVLSKGEGMGLGWCAVLPLAQQLANVGSPPWGLSGAGMTGQQC
jgi:hypothetical protein